MARGRVHPRRAPSNRAVPSFTYIKTRLKASGMPLVLMRRLGLRLWVSGPDAELRRGAHLCGVFSRQRSRETGTTLVTHTPTTHVNCGSGEHDVMHLHRAYGTAAVEENSCAKEHYMYPSPAAKGTSLGARAMACPCTCQPPPRLLWLSRGLLLERREHVVDHLPGAGGGR